MDTLEGFEAIACEVEKLAQPPGTAARYLRACKLMYRKWKWLVESEWGDCYGTYPHEVKRRIAELRAELLERCEAMDLLAHLLEQDCDDPATEHPVQWHCPDCDGPLDEGLNPYEDGYHCPGCRGYIEYGRVCS